MEKSHSFWSTCRAFLTQCIARLAIHFKWLKAVSYTDKQLNEKLAANFPQRLTVPLINTDGQLTLLNAKLSMPLAQKKFHIQLFCAFHVSIAGHDIYRAHLTVYGTVFPYYIATEKAIRIKDMGLSELRLVNDDYAFIRSSAEITTLFMPKSFKNLLLSTVQLTLSVVKDFVPNELLHYLELYTTGSKQQILDFHQDDIENILEDKIAQEDWYYLLDEDDFEERLFAEFGQDIAIENGKLIFKFHLD